MYGYAGRILHVDLSTRKTTMEPLREELARNTLEASDFGMRLLLDHSKAGIEPLSAENQLILTTGPMAGTMAPTAGNGIAFVSNSPLTNGVGKVMSARADLKREGYDAAR